ncbi:hypothetical protein XU18_4038, partial [Perkinsela sp. CCAP 1560/4]
LIKCCINDICVDISFNQLLGPSTALFITEVNNTIPKGLFKRSLILLKAWAYYESRTLGAHGGLLGSYALTIMLISVCNQMHMESKLGKLTTELDVLLSFFEFYTKYDVRCSAITIYGVQRYSLEDGESHRIDKPSDQGCIIDREFVRKFRLQNRHFLGQLDLEDGMLPSNFLDSDLDDRPYNIQTHRHINIVDPLRSNNNLARGVNLCHATRIQLSILRAAQELQALLCDSQMEVSRQIPSSRMAMVRHSNFPILIKLEHGYPYVEEPILQGSILSFFENSFRKCVLPKLLEKKLGNKSDADFDKLLRFGGSINKPKYRNPYSNQGGLSFASQIRKNQSGHTYASHGMIFRPHPDFEAQWWNSRKPKRNNVGAGGATSLPTLQMSNTTRHLSPSPDDVSKNQPGNRTSRITPKHFLNPKKTCSNDKHSYHAGDLIATIYGQTVKKISHTSRPPAQRRSSSFQLSVSPRASLTPLTLKKQCESSRSSSKHPSLEDLPSIPKGAQQNHMTNFGEIDALQPVPLRQDHELSYKPMRRTPNHSRSYDSQLCTTPRSPYESFSIQHSFQRANSPQYGPSMNRHQAFRYPRAPGAELYSQFNVPRSNHLQKEKSGHADSGYDKKALLGLCNIEGFKAKKLDLAVREKSALAAVTNQSLSPTNPSTQKVSRPSEIYVPPHRRRG